MGTQESRDIGSRREMFVDNFMVDELTGGARLRLHRPQPEGVSLVFDRPWEGNSCGYGTVFADGNYFRMYYRGSHVTHLQDRSESTPQVTCYAESSDGIHWHRPELGLCEFNGSSDNNIILTPKTGRSATHNFCPFRDSNPEAPRSERYKALGGNSADWGGDDLLGFVSPDGIRWEMVGDEPLITTGNFDSQNVSFYDNDSGQYRAYARDSREGRDIRTCCSEDYRHWSDPEFLEYDPDRTSQLYTNQVQPYYRAPHILLGLPTRYVERPWIPATDYLPQTEYRRLRASQSPRQGSAVTDTMLMAGRDGRHFRIWPESFLRPGLRGRNAWFYGDNYTALGMIETASRVSDAPRELSLFVSEGSHQRTSRRLRRYSLRVDGFASAYAPLSGGELVTPPLTFTGRKLLVNYSTGAAGSLKVEIQSPGGDPVPGHGLKDAEEMFGDSLEQPILWEGGADVSGIQETPVRLRFVLRDADLYSFQFSQR